MKDFFIQTVYAADGLNNPTGGSSPAFDKLLNNILNQIVTPVVYLLFFLAVVYFVWGVFKFIQNADNPEERAIGFKHMIYGVIGVFIMLSAKGIINIILYTIGLK